MGEILPGVHIVDGYVMPGWPSGGSINICLLVDNGVATLVDSGMPGVSVPLATYLGRIGLEPRAIRRIIITHHHIDHTGGLPEAVSLTGAEVWAHRDDAGFIDGSLKRPEPPAGRREAILAALPAEEREAAIERMRKMSNIPPVAVDVRLVGGEELNILEGCQILHTPGHTPGHLSLYLPEMSLLIAGDLLRYEGEKVSGPPEGFTADPDKATASVSYVATLGFDRLIGYHGGYLLSGAREAIKGLL